MKITNMPSRIVRGRKITYSDLWYSTIEALDEINLLADALFKYGTLHSGIDKKHFIDFIYDEYMGKLPDMFSDNVAQQYES